MNKESDKAKRSNAKQISNLEKLASKTSVGE